MPDSATLVYRGIVLEDLMQVTVAGPTVATVLGVGPGVIVSPIVTAADDAGASLAGVPLGGCYIVTSTPGYSYLKARLT